MSTTRPICLITVFVCLLAISNFLSAFPCHSWGCSYYVWNPVGGDCSWDNPANWDREVWNPEPPPIPRPDYSVIIPPKLPGPCITGDAACLELIVMPWSWTGAPDIDVTVISGNFNCGDEILICAGDLFDSSTCGIGKLNVFGGTVTTPIEGASGLTIGGGNTGYGDNYGRVNMYGGLVSVPRIALQFGDVNLFGGTLECTTDTNFILRQDRPENKINVNGGTLKLKGNHAAELSNYIASGRIVCIRGGALGAPVYDGTWTTLTGTNNFNVAWGPSPDNNATNIHYKDTNSIALSWQKGDLAKQYDVYFGTSTGSLVYQGSRYDANGDPCSFTIKDPNNFAPYTSYYWRIDETNDSNVMAQGSVWKFTTHDGRASNPKPVDGATSLSEPLQLSWTSGDWTAVHRVYFGTLYSAVSNASTFATDGRYRGTVSSPVYPLTRLLEKGANLPGASWVLQAGTTYYWRVDEVNGTTLMGGKGPVWSFTPAAYINIEDFEDYNSTDELTANWPNLYPVTGCGDPTIIGNAGRTLIRDSTGKYMRYSYYHDSAGMSFSEAKRPYSGGTSFTGSGVLSPAPLVLRIDYRGTAVNAADPVYDRMYVAIEDTAGNVSVYDNPDGNAALVGNWTSWYSNLYDINEKGLPHPVNLEAITGFAIGFGLRCNIDELGGGDGNVMFDNIRLYPQTCEWPGVFQADFDGDCYVGLEDLAYMAQFWLIDCTPPNPCPIGQPVVDIHPDYIIDFKDFAILGQEWKVILLGP